jgi:hypothetical protein
MEPTVRPAVFDAYWRFAAERQRIFDLRARDRPGPWTEDPILRQYKFCNTFRASDRVSQHLIAQVIYGPYGQDLKPEDVFLRIVLFRLFSKESTWETLEQVTGGVRSDTLDVDRLGAVLDDLRRDGPIYTAAFILCAHDAYGHKIKHRNHLELVRRMFAPAALGVDLAAAKSLGEVYEALRAWPMIGTFMGYQLAVDLNYAEQLNFDEDDFTVPGPGAVRGLQKVFSDFAGHSPQQLIMWMVDRQEAEFDRLGLDWNGLFGRRLHAIDCQGLFCETDKYARAAFPELKSNRVRIKQEFRNPKPRLDLFYPPKWGLNHGLPSRRDSASDSDRVEQLTLDNAHLHVIDGHQPDRRVSRPAPSPTLFNQEPVAALG